MTFWNDIEIYQDIGINSNIAVIKWKLPSRADPMICFQYNIVLIGCVQFTNIYLSKKIHHNLTGLSNLSQSSPSGDSSSSFFMPHRIGHLSDRMRSSLKNNDLGPVKITILKGCTELPLLGLPYFFNNRDVHSQSGYLVYRKLGGLIGTLLCIVTLTFFSYGWRKRRNSYFYWCK